MVVSTPVYGQTTRLQLQPNPANASFDANAIQLSFSGGLQSWTAVEQQRVWSEPLSFDITPLYPGQKQIEVTVSGEPVNVVNATTGEMNTLMVADQLELQKGWQWRSNAFGEIGAYNINMVFSDNMLIEARTQDALLYNDPTWGYFGTLMDNGIAQNTCYKVKMADTPEPILLVDGRNDYEYSIQLTGEWTWVAVPYYYDRTLAEALDPTRSSLPEGMVVVTKEDGSAEFDGTAWKGDLTLLRKGQGLMVYSPLTTSHLLSFTPESELLTPSSAPARLYDSTVPAYWNYDASRFMNNTTIVATLPQAENLSDEWSIGVFVGNECRGEGHFVDGLFFITAHTDRGELISMKLRHEPTGKMVGVEETLTTGQLRIGSIRQPMMLHADLSIVGISETKVHQKAVSYCDLTGRKVGSQRSGIVLQRQADGTFRKIFIRK
jgi:hypothetical protein